MEPRINHGGLVGAEPACRSVATRAFASRRPCSDAKYGESKETRSEATVRHWTPR
jgi:hypothetical protein